MFTCRVYDLDAHSWVPFAVTSPFAVLDAIRRFDKFRIGERVLDSRELATYACGWFLGD